MPVQLQENKQSAQNLAAAAAATILYTSVHGQTGKCQTMAMDLECSTYTKPIASTQLSSAPSSATATTTATASTQTQTQIERQLREMDNLNYNQAGVKARTKEGGAEAGAGDGDGDGGGVEHGV